MQAAVFVGLTDDEAAHRLRELGRNELPKSRPPSLARRALRQLLEPMSVILIVAASASWLILGHPEEGAAIGAIVLLNVCIATAQERRAESAIAALGQIAAPMARVHRRGRVVEIDAAEVVVGDLVDIVAGDRVPADLTLVLAESLAIDEAMLTGESQPADKQGDAPARLDAMPADRPGEAFAGTLVVRGRGLGIVARTGAGTQLGAIAHQLGDETDPPLVVELRTVARRLSLVAALLGLALIPITILRGNGSSQAILDAVLAGVALAIAALPEGLATVVTTALALGARRMAARGAIVRHLPAIEALGSATVICTDKTGTITSGTLTVSSVVAVDGNDDMLWLIARRCNDAFAGVGDPVDVALLDAAAAAGELGDLGVRISERPFDASTRSMSTVHLTEAGPVLSVKGAPEAIFARCRPGSTAALVDAVADLSKSGQRVLALAFALTDDLDAVDLTPAGLVGLNDPLRPSTRQAIADCHRAGIRVVLVTGDHAGTAKAIAGAAGLPTNDVITGADLRNINADERANRLRAASVVARVDPALKVELIEAHRAAGDVVAMTGDGVNDAPALRRADIGVAVGISAGTAVAREAAGMVLTNGDLGTLVAAISEGRRIYRNLRTVISYLIVGNMSEVMVVMYALVLFPQIAIPLLPVQLLWLNLATDGMPALALGLDQPAGDPLASPPRASDDRLLHPHRLLALARRAVAIATIVSATGVLAEQWGWSDDAVRSQLLLSLLAAHLVLAYVSRAERWTFERGWWRNRMLFATIVGTSALQVCAFGTDLGRELLGVTTLPASGWLLALSAAGLTVLTLDFFRSSRRAEVTGGGAIGGRRPR